MVNNIFQKSSLLFLIGSLTLVACNDDNNGGNSLGELEEEEELDELDVLEPLPL